LSFIIYIALLSICVASLLTTRSVTSRPIKVIAIIVLIHGYLTIGSTYKQISGYPTFEKLPEKFEIIWARVVESNDEKFIEIWINYDGNINDYLVDTFSLANNINYISRVYRIPYSEENHETIVELQKKIKRGEKVGIKNIDNKGNEEIDLRESEVKFRSDYESKRIIK
jgi:hypothetical protein